MDLDIRRFDQPDEQRPMPLGRFDLVRLGGTSVGRASYQPGWRWSLHVGQALGQSSCSVWNTSAWSSRAGIGSPWMTGVSST